MKSHGRARFQSLRGDQDAGTHRGTTVRGHRERTAVYTPRRGASEGTNPANPLTSTFSLPHCEGTNVCTPPGL